MFQRILTNLWDKRTTLPQVQNVRSYLISCLRFIILLLFGTQVDFIGQTLQSFPVTMETAYDKWRTKDLLSYFGIPVTPGKMIFSMDSLKEIKSEYDFR